MKYLTTSQAGEILGVSNRTVIRMIKAEALPAFQSGLGNQWRIDRADAERIRDQRRNIREEQTDVAE